MREIKQGSPTWAMLFMADAADHRSGKTGLTLAVTLSKDGGAFEAVTPTVTERGGGWYAVALDAVATDTLGELVVAATASGADPGQRLLSVYGLKDADVVRIAGADQSPRDLGRRLEEATIGMRLLYVKVVPKTFTASFSSWANVWGTMDFWLSDLVDGALTPTLRLGQIGEDGFYGMDPQWGGNEWDQFEGYLCLKTDNVVDNAPGIITLGYLDVNAAELSHPLWFPKLPVAAGEELYLGLDGNYYRTSDGLKLTAHGRFNPFLEASAQPDIEGTVGRLLNSTYRNGLNDLVTVDGWPDWQTLDVSTDRPIPPGAWVRVLAYSQATQGTWEIGTYSSGGWAGGVPDRPLVEGLSLMVGIELEGGVSFPATGLSFGLEAGAKKTKVYLPARPPQEYGSWTDMVFLGVTGQPVRAGSGAVTGDSLADTQSTPSRKAVIIGA